MPTTFANFKQTLPPIILQRGQDYFSAGLVIDLAEVDAGHWLAIVQGTDAYQVSIQSSPDNALVWLCDCPYDRGPVCKHVAAVLYAIESAKAQPPVTTRADQVRAALKKLSPTELYNLLVELALNDRNLTQIILTRYGPALDDKDAAVQLVQNALSLEQGRHGYLDYQGTQRAARRVEQFLGQASSLLEKGRPEQAITIFQAILETVAPTLGHADDSSGALHSCVSLALDYMRATAAEISPGARAALVDYLLEQSQQEIFASSDWRWEMVTGAADLVSTPDQRAQLFAALDRMAARSGQTGWAAAYDQEQAASIKLEVIERLDAEPAVIAFLQQNNHLTRMRLLLARRLLAQGDVAAARQICREWLDQPTQSPGLRVDFLALLLQAAEMAGDQDEQIELVEMLFLDTGQFAYYEQLKGLIGAGWPAFRAGFLARAQEGRRVDKGALYVAEGMWDQLLAYVQARPQTIHTFYEYLAPRFPAAIGAMYEQLALDTLRQQANRNGYQAACSYLQRMQEVGMAARVAELVAQWRTEYKRYRALQEELNRTFGR